MTWVRKLPEKEGRYWWREPSRYGDGAWSYGLLLLVWARGYMDDESPPRLVVATLCIMHSLQREGEGGSGWSYSGGASHNFAKDHPRMEFWSEPELGPEGYLPELPPKPDWTPPTPEQVEEKRRANVVRAAEVVLRHKAEEAERQARIDEARAKGVTLYKCDDCDALWSKEETVQVRECPHCDYKFNGTEEGQNCPQCNRRFTRNLTEHGCPDCLDEESCNPLDVVAEAAPVATPKRKKRSRR